MFDKIPEREARVIRRTLAFGWVLIIVSLFWDPLTIQLTSPTNTASPFRLNPHALLEDPAERYQCPIAHMDPVSGIKTIDWGGKEAGTCDSRCIHVQGQCLIEEPYAMGTHLFWGLVIPLVPLFLMVFGHEAWRRVCPLSFFSQIPRALGIQRKRKTVNMQTGMVEKKIVLISPDSWLGRYHWFVQFGLLFTGLTLRIYFINSDRTALGIFFISVIVIALLVGYFYGGKTWCNYLCPISPVQKFYTEPRGLFESESHFNKKPITQSMCRTYSKDGREQSNCVGCKSPCSDIDLERAYWESHDAPGRRFFYFGYLGFVIGAYTYYYMYSGSWNYYPSGAWTHEGSQLFNLWKPGFYWNGQTIPIPKWIAGPLYVGGWIFLTYGVGCLLEKFYERIRLRMGKLLPHEYIRHHMFIFSSYLTINIFYLFAGRVYLNTLPTFLLGTVDIGIVALTSFWAWRNFGRTSLRYKREGLGDSLRRQLKKMKLDLSKLLDGRRPEDLSPDETYVLAKTLPGFSHDHQYRMYKEMLRDAIQSGWTNSVDSMSLMQELRQQFNLTQQEHEEVLLELGVEDSSLLDPHKKQTQEDQLRLANYRDALKTLVQDGLEKGTPTKDVLQKPEVSKLFQELRASYNITQAEQSQMVAEVMGEQGGLLHDAHAKVLQLQDLVSKQQSLIQLNHTPSFANGNMDLETKTAIDVLEQTLSKQRVIFCQRLLELLFLLEPNLEAQVLAHTLRVLAPEELQQTLRNNSEETNGETSWQRRLNPVVLGVLEQKGIEFTPPEKTVIPWIEKQDLNEGLPSPSELLLSFIRGNGAIPQAAALYLQAKLDQSQTQKYAHALLNQESLDGLSSREEYSFPDWIVQDLATYLSKGETVPSVEDKGVYQTINSSVFQKLLLLYHGNFLQHIDLEALADLAKNIELREYAKGAIICETDEPSNELFLICSGAAEVIVQKENNEQKILTLAAGQTVGELGVLMHTPRSATVIAKDDTNKVLTLKGEVFEEFLSQNGRTAISYLRVLGDRLLQTTTAIHKAL